MRQNFEFVGKNIEDHIEPITRYLQDKEVRGLEKIDGELEKTDSDISMINLAEELLSDFLKEMNISYESLGADHVHFLSKEGMVRFGNEKKRSRLRIF